MSVFETLLSGLDVTTFTIFLLVFLLGYYWLSKPSNLPPGPPGLPVLGHLISVGLAGPNLLSLLKKWRQQYGDIYTIRLGSKYLIVISDYETMRDAYVKNADNFTARPDKLYSVTRFKAALGSGIAMSNGQEWKDMRRLTLTTLRDFGVGKKSLEHRVLEEARAMVEVLDKSQDQAFVIQPLMAKFSANIICSIVLGNRFDYEDADFQELIKKLHESLEDPILFTPANFVSFFRYVPACEKAIWKVINGFVKLDKVVERLLKDHEETYEPGEVRDFVDLYIKTRSEAKDSRLYSAANMRSVILDLLGAGTDTTATAMEWNLLYLIAHPEVQKRCQQDIDRVIGHGRMVTMDDRKDLPYIMAVITEIHRISPVASLGVPHMAEREGRIGRYTVPAESIIMINAGEIHREPTVWDEPNVFKPERFLDKDGQFNPPRDNFIPFSVGPRVCLGESLARMELFILLTTLLQSFTFTMPQGQKPDLEGVIGLTFSAKAQHVLATRRQ